jgi:glycosyltransferase involved in cell wall biosynthesis
VLAAGLTRTPTIFHLHLILTRRLERVLVRQLARRVTRILACSHAAATSLVDRDRRLLSKTQVLYNPLPALQQPRVESVDPTRPANPDCFTIGIVGRITEQKGHHLLVQAVAMLPERLRRKIRILVVGSGAPGCRADGAYLGRLREQAARLGLHEQIVWTGHRSDPGPCYESIDVLVHPAREEAMCIAILEALDRGIPVIAARSGGIPEVVRDGFNGLLVSLKEPAALSEALTRYFDHRSVRERLGAGASRGLDRRFSMETFASKIRTAIGQLCPLT